MPTLSCFNWSKPIPLAHPTQINGTTDQDSPWKEILEYYFPEFLLFFFPHIHPAIDWSKPHEFLDKELQKVIPNSKRGKRFADKLVKVWLLDGQETWILIHVEVQGRKESHFPERMYVYNYRIGDHYNRPVLSIAILSDANPDWRPNHYQQEILGCRTDFQFLSAKLLDYRDQQAELEENTNPFAIVVLAHLKSQETKGKLQQRKSAKLFLIRRLYEKGYDRQDIINLFRFIDWIIELPRELEDEVWQVVEEYEQEGQMPYVTSVERIGMEKGLQQGRQEGRQEGLQQGRQEGAIRLLLKVLEKRFGTISEKARSQFEKLSPEQLEELVDEALESESWEEFAGKLPKPSRRKPEVPGDRTQKKPTV